MSNGCDKMWLQNLGALFSSFQLVPTNTMSLADQTNSLTRLIGVIFIILLLFDFRYSIHFLIISTLVLIILYYIQRNTMQQKNCQNNGPENYGKPIIEYYKPQRKVQYQPPYPIPGEPYDMSKLAVTKKKLVNGRYYDETYIETPEELYFCNDLQENIDVDNKNIIGLNQRLTVGPDGQTQNPNTYIKPVVIPPTHDLSYWRDNDMIVYAQINSAGAQEDMYLSGYAESTCCGYLEPGSRLVPQTSRENFPQRTGTFPGGRKIVSPVLVEDRIPIKSMPVEGYRENYPQRTGTFPGGRKIVSPVLVEDRIPIKSIPVEGYQENYQLMPEQPGMMNTACGYNPDQLQVNLPSNLAVGNCQKSPAMAEYNRNLFTQTVTPGVYTLNQINEPINSNIGISFQQQFEPTTCDIDDNGNVHYLEHDPRVIEPDTSPSEAVMDTPRYDNVYDPRFYGYGTSYRSYNEPMVGQTRFMYDDVNAIRMPNYVTRSKIDHLPYADTYGPVVEGSEMGNVHNPNIRSLVQDSWMRDSLQFRNDLTERRMRKNNAVNWQRRMAPHGPRMK